MSGDLDKSIKISTYLNENFKDNMYLFIKKSDEVVFCKINKKDQIKDYVNDEDLILEARLFNEEREIFIWKSDSSYKLRIKEDSLKENNLYMDSTVGLNKRYKKLGDSIVIRNYITKNSKNGIAEISDFRLVNIN